MPEYRVNLDIYNGPLDLLLYLIRREEVDIHDIPIARITSQYVKYVEMLQQLDPNLAGEFLVLAATLMEIKTQILLPVQESEDGEEEGLEIDPRADLIRQLLQYKAFKDAAGDLQQSAEIQSLKFPRKPGGIDLSEDEQPDKDLEDLQIWDLFDAFRGVMDAIGNMGKQHEVIYDDTPLELYKEDLIDRLQREGTLSFKKIFEGRHKRVEMIGIFLAMLELMKMRTLRVRQDANFHDIQIELNPNPPTVEQLEEEMAVIKEQQAKAEAAAQARDAETDEDFDDEDDFDEDDEDDDFDDEDFDFDENDDDEEDEFEDDDDMPGRYVSESAVEDDVEEELEEDFDTEDWEDDDNDNTEQAS